MSDTARARLEAEAAMLYPLREEMVDTVYAYREGCRTGYVRAKTMSAEQVEAAARVMHNMTVDTLWGECASEQQADLKVIRAAFSAAGFLVEGADDE